MTFEQLLYAKVLASQHSLQEAADILHISKSALSLAITQLEEELNVKIFDRTRKGTVVTYEGQQILSSISDLLRSKSKLENLANNINNHNHHHTISIEYMNPLMKSFIDVYLEQKNTKYQNVSLYISCKEFEAIVEHVRNHQIDAGFIAINTQNLNLINDLNFISLFQSKLNIICSKRNSLNRKQTKITLDDLKQQKFCLFNESFHDTIFDRLQYLCGPLNLILRVDDSWAMAKAINELDVVTFGRSKQLIFTKDVMFQDMSHFDISHIIDDNFLIGWITNPNYELSSIVNEYIKDVSETLK